MNAYFLPSWQVTEVISVQRGMLRYQFGLVKRQRKYIYCAALKVPEGLRFTLGESEDVPSIPLVQNACLLRGDFAPRPYMLGQDSDPCSEICLFALLHDCCIHFGLDTAGLVGRAYPGGSATVKQLALDWALTRRDATWQGTVFPQRWTGDSLTGLLLSLHNHYRPKLAEVLLDAIGPS